MTKKKKPLSLEERARKAGSVTSDAKAESCRENASVITPRTIRASRKNGKLGGRPGNPKIKQIMEERGVSRQRAWQIWKDKERT